MAGGLLATGEAGHSPNNRKRKATVPFSAAAVDDEGEAKEEEDIEELERELADLDRRVLENRRRNARRFLDTATSHLAALRPPADLDDSTVFEPSIADNDQEKLEKAKVIKYKCEANAIALQKVLERINECIAQSERLENMNVNIHPVFLRKL